ncbi:MAG: T9SS type A sorting domain-containing protein [Sphingobacteriales bacterium]|nr:MAG: T9SS type A sorting domain-containing protein [Sphingobacteriales bacterium]
MAFLLSMSPYPVSYSGHYYPKAGNTAPAGSPSYLVVHYRTGDVKIKNDADISARFYTPCAVWNRPPLAIPKISDQDKRVTVYPNPSTDRVGVMYLSAQKSKGDANMSIIDATGRLICETTLHLHNGQNVFQAALSNMPSGLYWLTITDGSGGHTARFIKK